MKSSQEGPAGWGGGAGSVDHGACLPIIGEGSGRRIVSSRLAWGTQLDPVSEVFLSPVSETLLLNWWGHGNPFSLFSG